MKKENEIKIQEIFSLAFKNHKEKNYIVAKNFYNKVLQINPNHFESIFLLGSLAMQNNNLTQSKDYYERAAKIKPINKAYNDFICHPPE